MFDAKLMLIDSASNVTAAVTGSALDFKGEDMAQLVYRILVPAAAANTSMTVTIQESDNGTDWVDLVKSEAITAAGQKHIHARGKKRYRRALIAVTGTGPNFGKVKIGVVPAGIGTDW